MSQSQSSNAKPDVLMCVLSYLGLFALIPFFVKKDDPFVQWHAKQGLVLLVAAIALSIAMGVLGMVLPLSLLGLVGGVAWLGVLGLMVFCIVQAVQGQKWAIPVLSNFVSKVPDAP